MVTPINWTESIPLSAGNLDQMEKNTLDLVTGHRHDGIESRQLFLPCCKTEFSVAQSIPTGVTTVVDWDYERFDVGSMHSNSVNNSRITIPVGGAGKYYVHALISFASDLVGTRQYFIRKNGVSQFSKGEDASNYNNCDISSTFDLAEGDYLEISVNQTSGGALNILAGYSFFEVFKVSY